jgi:hypothetical protein
MEETLGRIHGRQPSSELHVSSEKNSADECLQLHLAVGWWIPPSQVEGQIEQKLLIVAKPR